MWLEVDFTKHPSAGSRDLIDIEEEIFNSCIENGVLVARGSWFLTEKNKKLPGLYFRTTYASASPENMSAAIKRFSEAVKKSFEQP
jgi:aromatic amino acid aminotransferase I / 2-aminoadipate transaminase